LLLSSSSYCLSLRLSPSLHLSFFYQLVSHYLSLSVFHSLSLFLSPPLPLPHSLPVKRHCPPVFLFVTVLWHRKLWSGQSAKVQGSFRLLICFYLSKCSKISVSPHNNPL